MWCIGKNMNLDSVELSDIKITSLKLMGENLLIEPFERKEIKGFIIPDNKKEKPTIGKVLKVGNGHIQEKKIEMLVSEGDIVIFNEWSAKSIDGLKNDHHNSKNTTEIKLFYLKQSDVIAFISGGK
jgi:co-chaperonin GroES (HSP10)